jgi:SAM-dependent methyltransferase
MSKLNFGCGDRIADGWINVDFHASDPRVRRFNLLKGFPYPDNHFEVVYSSHVLEHFTREQAQFLLSEANRVLKPGGILRIVVPDLAGTCKEYLRILALPDNERQKGQLYSWIIIELLDQLVRSRPSGEMGPFLQKLRDGDNREMSEYVRSRTENTPWAAPVKTSFLDKLRRVTPQKVASRLTYWHLRCVGRLIPRHLRSMVLIETSIGERHRWMYDFYGLSKLCEKAGFLDCRALSYNESAIPGFHEDHLDSNPDGTSYKNNSVYLESSKNV